MGKHTAKSGNPTTCGDLVSLADAVTEKEFWGALLSLISKKRAGSIAFHVEVSSWRGFFSPKCCSSSFARMGPFRAEKKTMAQSCEFRMLCQTPAGHMTIVTDAWIIVGKFEENIQLIDIIPDIAATWRSSSKVGFRRIWSGTAKIFILRFWFLGKGIPW